MTLPALWPHQEAAIRGTLALMQRGARRIAVTTPTGGGKSRDMAELARQWLSEGKKVAIYVNRKLLMEQLHGNFSAMGIEHGVRASLVEPNLGLPLQLCSIQTEDARVLKKGSWEIHDADRIIIEEAHLNKSTMITKLLRRHLQKPGSAYIGFTATPIDIGGLYDELLIAGSPSELRRAGAIVRARHFGPDEPDTSEVGKRFCDYTEADVVKTIRVHQIFGNIVRWYGKLNPDRAPTLLFAPGVAESIWLAEQLTFPHKRTGPWRDLPAIKAAHIDGDSCWLDGQFYPSSNKMREWILNLSRCGAIDVVCNRFVLREGVDMPWVRHIILATLLGTLQGYLQVVGRGMRADVGKRDVCLQDHGGHWWKHGSPNVDREWTLEDTEASLANERTRRVSEREEEEPVRCPQCSLICESFKCPYCGPIQRRSRMVVMRDGMLREHVGDCFKPIRKTRDGAELQWFTIFQKAKVSGQTFREAESAFFKAHGYWPASTLPFMPTLEIDRFRKIKDVPTDRLVAVR